jgi:hypothetical protein
MKVCITTFDFKIKKRALFVPSNINFNMVYTMRGYYFGIEEIGSIKISAYKSNLLQHV